MGLVMVSCNNQGTPKKEEGQNKQYKVGLSMNTQTNPFFVTVVEGCKKAAQEKGMEIFVTDAQDDPATQMKDVENLITKQVDVMIIDPCDSDAIVAAVEACNKANIPVFTMDRESKGGEVVAHIGYDAIKSGKLAGEFLAKALGNKGNVVELQGIMGTNVAQNRSEGFNSIMSENKDITIVARQTANFDRATAMSVMENILQANEKIDGLYAANDEMLLGALEAIQAAGRQDEMIVIGCDALDETLAGIKEGKIDATIAEPPFFLGKAMVNTAYDYLNGKKVESRVILENQLVDKNNVEQIKTRD
ncbi:MAG: substrate-binding domain-containing protein [Eubacteriales bacterium]|nr:substrate-binding domain-containing protein [Eubacteriales bacterium]